MASFNTPIPSRTATNFSSLSDDAVPESDPGTTAGLLAERLQAWKHAVGYLEEYVEAVEKIHKVQAKEYEKALKTISQPLKEGHHFDQSLGGIAGFFENLRNNTQAIINTNLETEKAIKTSVLTVLERLHKEVKHKAKELSSGAGKGSKEVEKARNTTQKQIELLGQHTASFESAGGRVTAHDDPYVVRRGVLHRLHKQVLEENGHRNDLIAVQANFQEFETHIIKVLQEAVEALSQLAGGQGEKVRVLHSDVLGAIQRVPADFEWNAFTARCADRLIDPNEPPRSVDTIAFPNMDHAGARALIEGSLERKSRNKLSWGYQSGYYVVTPAKFLHEFKDSDDVRQEPKPELSIYLPDALIGNVSGDKFSVKGKDASKTLSSKLSGSSELNFKAHSPVEAERWFKVIKGVADSSAAAAAVASPVSPISPASPVSPLAPASPAEPAAAAATPVPAQAPVEKDTLVMNEAVTPAAAEQQHPAQETGVTGDSANVVPQVDGGEKAAAAAAQT